MERNTHCNAEALSLFEDDDHQIKDKVFDQIPLHGLKSEF